MKARTLLGALAIAGMALLCVRLGFWQLSRLEQKRAINAALREAMNAPPVAIGSEPPPLEAVRHRRVMASGTYDEAHQVLLAGRSSGGSPGVSVVTPLRLGGGSAVLIERGWLFAGNAATARPQDSPEPGPREVIGIADSIPAAASGSPWRAIETNSITLWSTHRLVLDSIRARLPYAIAPYLLRQLPSPDLPIKPVRSPPRPLDETMHLSYAVQWFLFAVILVVGPPLAIASRRRARARPTDLVIPKL